MRFLVDVGVGVVVESRLRAGGHDVRAVRDLDPRMKDDEILALAVREARTVLTMDKDFGELVYRSGEHHCGVLLMRLEDASGAVKADVVEEILRTHADELLGRFSVYQRGRLRIRE
jgi:predicted nuclease of predicted toxin-antitoxin system